MIFASTRQVTFCMQGLCLLSQNLFLFPPFFEGSYSCACSSGYMLLLDGRSCRDVDECDAKGIGLGGLGPCGGGKCVNTPGSFSCVCSGGLVMGAGGSSCRDLDECAINKDVCK